MGLFDKIKKGIEASYSDEGPSPEALASLTPEQRAAYDANMARVAEAQAQVRGNHLRLTAEHAERFARRPLQGAAGEFLYGPAQYPGADPNELMGMSAAEQVEYSMQVSKDQITDALRNPFGSRKPKPDPGAPPDTRSPQQVATDEWNARAQAKAPYLSPTRAPSAVTRIATRGKSQLEELATYLASSGLGGRPELIYGVYRVPDRISPAMMGSEKGRVVEWDIVHAASATLPPAPVPDVRWFPGEEHWVARAVGEPSVLDEDLVLLYLAAAGIGPEQTIGIARKVHIRGYGGDEGDVGTLWSRVEGTVVFTPPGLAPGVHERMLAARPLDVAPGPPAGIHVEVLNWGAIAKVVHPERHRPPANPSPFPYLPSTGQELLLTYLDVVGLNPGDCYSAQVTKDRPGDIMGVSERAGGLITVTSNMGTSLPCADGKARRRMHGGTLVVVAYRDRPAYVEGRARWAAFQRDVYQATLENETGARRPVEPTEDAGLPKALRGVLKAVDVVDSVLDAGSFSVPDEAPHRYCWPPIVRS